MFVRQIFIKGLPRASKLGGKKTNNLVGIKNLGVEAESEFGVSLKGLSTLGLGPGARGPKDEGRVTWSTGKGRLSHGCGVRY